MYKNPAKINFVGDKMPAKEKARAGSAKKLMNKLARLSPRHVLLGSLAKEIAEETNEIRRESLTKEYIKKKGKRVRFGKLVRWIEDLMKKQVDLETMRNAIITDYIKKHESEMVIDPNGQMQLEADLPIIPRILKEEKTIDEFTNILYGVAVKRKGRLSKAYGRIIGLDKLREKVLGDLSKVDKMGGSIPKQHGKFFIKIEANIDVYLKLLKKKKLNEYWKKPLDELVVERSKLEDSIVNDIMNMKKTGGNGSIQAFKASEKNVTADVLDHLIVAKRVGIKPKEDAVNEVENMLSELRENANRLLENEKKAKGIKGKSETRDLMKDSLRTIAAMDAKISQINIASRVLESSGVDVSDLTREMETIKDILNKRDMYNKPEKKPWEAYIG